MERRLAVAVSLISVLLMLPAEAAGPGEKCSAAKLKAAGRKAQGLIACYARGRSYGTGPDGGCISKVEDKFNAAWARIEAKGGCATQSDAGDIETRVNQFVSDLDTALPPSTTTSTTTTPTSTCPPTTAFYCAFNSCAIGIAICPSGMTCTDTGGGTCTCTGSAPPCGGGISPNQCQFGACPAGMTCVNQPGGCYGTCGCQ